MTAIGLAFHPQMLAFGEAHHNFGLEDPVIRGQLEIVYSGGAWRSWNKQQQALARELLNPAEYADIC